MRAEHALPHTARIVDLGLSMIDPSWTRSGVGICLRIVFKAKYSEVVPALSKP